MSRVVYKEVVEFQCVHVHCCRVVIFDKVCTVSAWYETVYEEYTCTFWEVGLISLWVTVFDWLSF